MYLEENFFKIITDLHQDSVKVEIELTDVEEAKEFIKKVLRQQKLEHYAKMAMKCFDKEVK